MKLVRNWRVVAQHAWSIRLNLLLALLAGADAAVTYVVDGKLSSALVVFAVSIAASSARLVVQEKISGEPE